MIYGRVRFIFVVMMMSVIFALQTKFMEKSLYKLRDDYKLGAKADNGDYHEVVFAVKQKNLDRLERILNEVSNPKNEGKYGKFLTRKDIADLTANPKATEAITKFLLENGATITKKTRYGEYVTARAKVSTWEKLFATEFYQFHSENPKAKPVLRALEYSIPADLSEHVESVFNTVELPNVDAPGIAPEKQGKLTKSGSVTPAFLNSYYHITSNKGNSLASHAVYESLEQYYSPNDLEQFEQQYNIPSQAVAYDVGGYESDSICVTDSNSCAEANLDVQYLIAVAQGVPTTYWYDDSSDALISWITGVSDMENPPLVHSISYTWIETAITKSVANQFNTEAIKLGAQGVSILSASGDDGVSSFKARSNPRKCGYSPYFPASSPYVTAIGATQGPESGLTEVACQSDNGGVITTGGGFSNVYTAPDYQKSFIDGYFAALNKTQQPVSGYSTTGRGYPDISLAGFNYEVVIGGSTYKLSGTSASTPAIAGFVSLVNSARLAAGKPALGLLNQAIYQYASKFIASDITSGFNNCAASKVCCDQGYYAAKGWDPLTGFGSVDFQKFYDVFYNL